MRSTPLSALREALRSEQRTRRLLLRNLPDVGLAMYDSELELLREEGAVRIDVAGLMPLMRDALEGKQSSTEHHSALTNRTYWVEVVPHRLPDGDGIVGIAMDITDRKRAEERLRAAEERLRAAEERFRGTFEGAPIGMALMSLDGGFLEVNDVFCAMTGYEREQLESMTFDGITHPDDFNPSLPGQAELRVLHARGESVDVLVHVTVAGGPAGSPDTRLAMVQDVTERKRFDERLQHMADHDPLTGLLNRRRFEEELERQVASARRYGQDGAVIVLDVDHFSAISDSLGHGAGEELLVSVAGRLTERMRETDVLARLGGDEFAILIMRGDEETARAVAESLLAEVREHSVIVGGARHTVTISVGIAPVDGSDEVTAEDLIVRADLAVHDAKRAGRNGLAFYSPAEQEQSRIKARLTWIDLIEGALADDGFVLHAQPILDLRSERVSQHELLLRMDSGNGELVRPAAFINVAERSGQIGKIDRWVVARSVDIVAEHQRQGRELRLEVNLSGSSIGDPELLEVIECRLRDTGIDPRSLIFEITETAAVANVARAKKFAEHLLELGCRFALDDFGAGFGSFYYLKHLPFDFLKIDGEFVAGCAHNVTDRLVIDAVVTIAAGLGKKTIAEFVTDEETCLLLQELGVDYAQGSHVGMPAGLDALAA